MSLKVHIGEWNFFNEIGVRIERCERYDRVLKKLPSDPKMTNMINQRFDESDLQFKKHRRQRISTFDGIIID
jgi:hypothetical protein